MIGLNICANVNQRERGKQHGKMGGTNLKRSAVFASLMLVCRCKRADEGNLEVSAILVSFDCCGDVGGKMMRRGVGQQPFV